jgi:hypothetical protein
MYVDESGDVGKINSPTRFSCYLQSLFTNYDGEQH